MPPGSPASFYRSGPAAPTTPAVLSVPHAGRDYPAALLDRLLPGARIAAAMLEDRHVDAVARAAVGDEAMLVQRRARAWIDLNRREDERDPAVDEGAGAIRAGPDGARLRSGLGLVPRRAGACAQLWRRRWSDAEVRARIAGDHRPYHRALDEALALALARFGRAVLIDVHSMPPLPGDAGRARIVVGDRHGATAAPAVSAAVIAAARAVGLTAVRNAPYAGGHLVERHGRPAAGVHAVQVEIDRSLYLDAALDRPVPGGVARTGGALRAMIDAAVAASGGGDIATTLAAE